MSSEGSNSSDEEGGEAYDLLAKIQRQLNQEHHDEDDEEEEEEENENESKVSSNQINNNEKSEAKQEPNSGQSNFQSSDTQKEGTNNEKSEILQAQQNQNAVGDGSGINSKTNLEQQQITANEQSSSSEAAKQITNIQISQIDTKKQYVSSSSTSSQQNQQSLSPSKNLIAIQSTQPSEQMQADKQNEIPVNQSAPSSAVVTVRNEAIRKEETQDNLIVALEKISFTRNLLEDEDILGHRIDSYALEQTLESVRRRFDENLLRFSSKQKTIFDRIRDITKRSTLVAEQTNSSGKIFAKKKQADKEKHIKDVQRLSNDAAKTKTFLLMMITRLEAIEHEVDKLTDTQLKKAALAESKLMKEKIGVDTEQIEKPLNNNNNTDSQEGQGQQQK